VSHHQLEFAVENLEHSFHPGLAKRGETPQVRPPNTDRLCPEGERLVVVATRGAVKRNIPLLYGFSCFDQFMIVIAVWVPYLATQGIGMRQFMELQAVFALVILPLVLPERSLSPAEGVTP